MYSKYGERCECNQQSLSHHGICYRISESTYLRGEQVLALCGNCKLEDDIVLSCNLNWRNEMIEMETEFEHEFWNKVREFNIIIEKFE